MSATSTQRTPWIEVSPAALRRGEGLRPYFPGEIAILFDWVEIPTAGSKHIMPHRGQFIVDLVEIETNAVHQPSKPGDEVVVVLNGVLQLRTDATGTEQRIEAGQCVLIPAGWAGIYRVSAERGVFRELAIVPGNYFDEGVAPPPNDKLPRPLDLPRAPGTHELHRNRYVLELENVAHPTTRALAGETEEIVQVLDGTLSLRSGAESASYAAGSVVILPAGFQGEAHVTAGYRGLNARWLG